MIMVEFFVLQNVIFTPSILQSSECIPFIGIRNQALPVSHRLSFALIFN